MKKLAIGELYSREDVHDMFAPDTNFTPGAGVWGIQGVIKIPDSTGYIFFVTYGQSQSGHDFDESISDEGVLTWQSQPSQGLENKRILEWINHDETQSNIYLFLRTGSESAYSFYGRLKYLTHDTTREKPVFFQWELLDWDRLEVPSELKVHQSKDEEVVATPGLAKHAPPQGSANGNPPPRRDFSVRRKPNYAERDAHNRKLGLAGELLVLENEKERLASKGLIDLANKIIHVSEVEGDGAGYDIKSYKEDGTPLFIEVKTTRGGINTPFFISSGEVAFSELNHNNYLLVRIFNYSEKYSSGEYFELHGEIRAQVSLSAQTYKASIRNGVKADGG